MKTSLQEGYVLHEGYPSPPTYAYLRKVAGLSPKSEAQASLALKGSWYGCYITHSSPLPTATRTTKDDDDKNIIAMGRIVGDGGWVFSIVDMAVHPDHQRRGLGNFVLETLIEKIRRSVPRPPPRDPVVDGEKGKETAEELRDRRGMLPYINLFADEPGRKLYRKHGFVDAMPHSMGMVLRLADEWLEQD